MKYVITQVNQINISQPHETKSGKKAYLVSFYIKTYMDNHSSRLKNFDNANKAENFYMKLSKARRSGKPLEIGKAC